MPAFVNVHVIIHFLKDMKSSCAIQAAQLLASKHIRRARVTRHRGAPYYRGHSDTLHRLLDGRHRGMHRKLKKKSPKDDVHYFQKIYPLSNEGIFKSGNLQP